MLHCFSKIFLTLLSVLLSHPARVWACAVCFGEGDDAAGYNASVLFLMSAPYLVFGTIIGGLIFAYRRALKQRERAEEAKPVAQLTWNQEESGR